MSSPFVKAAASSEEEMASKVAPLKQETSEIKEIYETIIKNSSSGQKTIIRTLFQTENFGKAYKQNARSKPVLFVPEKGKPIAYESISAMARVTGLSKARLIGKSNFEKRGDIKRSSSAMNKAGLIRGLL